MARRVVITGIGLVCGLGNTTGEVWKNLLAGVSGVARITSFDVSQYSSQIAAEVKNFDPLNFIEKKELRKMARFIHLAIAASHEALTMSQLKVTADNVKEISTVAREQMVKPIMQVGSVFQGIAKWLETISGFMKKFKSKKEVNDG